MCLLQGDPQQINEATQKIREIIETVSIYMYSYQLYGKLFG